jgi:hypothetical protein
MKRHDLTQANRSAKIARVDPGCHIPHRLSITSSGPAFGTPPKSNYKGFPPKVKHRSNRDASRSDGLRDVTVDRQHFHPQRPARLLSEQGMRTAKLQTVIDAALVAADPDERRARGTHSLAEDGRSCLIDNTDPGLLELNGHAPRRSNPDSSTLAARGGGNQSL